MRTLTALFVLVALAAPIDAEHCTTYSTSPAEASAAGIYLDIELGQLDCCISSVWVYQESNGIEGLQRGDEVVDDTCHGMIERDTIIF